MKKRILCGVLAASLLLGSAGASFSDISDPGVQQAAAVLDSLGIMNGEGGGRFNPGGQLTRAQFCKLAVTALGVTDVSAYKNYSVFPDVPASHWASGYINAALKQADIEQKQIIRGFADGTFGPDKTISYGEVCTMLLRMLDYKVEDVGPFWPADYIAKAEALDLNRGIAHYGANDIVKRGDAAVMLLNTLQAPRKDASASKLMQSSVANSTIENSILLATSETDDDLRQGQARFYENGELVTRSMAATLDRCLIGTRGTVLFDKVTTSKVRAFVPENSDSETITVKQSYPDRIEIEGEKIKVGSKTPVVLNGEITTYGEAWPDLTPDYKLNIFYDSGHDIELISPANQTSGVDSFVYGTQSSVNIPQNYKIMKNGVEIDRSKLKQYDLVSLNGDSQTASASDRRITGYLSDAKPSFSHPTRVTVLGHEFSISDNAATYFSDMKYNDRVTLLLDSYGNVQAAFPASKVSSENIGVFGSSDSKESSGSVQLLAGVSVSGKISEDGQKLLGQLVRVSSDKNGNLSLSSYSGGKVSGAWSVDSRTIGSNKVASNVKIYEMVADKAPVTAITDNDLPSGSIAASDIRSTITDNAGSVIAIVLDDVTGKGWQYGMAYGNSKSTSSPGLDDDDKIVNYDNSVTLRTIEDGKAVTKTYEVTTLPGGLGGKPVGLPKGMDQIQGKIFNLPVKQLSIIDTVGLAAFDGTDGVKTASGYYDLPDDVGVYVSDYKKMIPLREAKTNFTSFTLYGDSNSSKNAAVRMIIAK